MEIELEDKIDEQYNKYLSELNDNNAENNYINRILKNELEKLKRKEKSANLFLWSLVNLVISIMNMTLFRDEEIIDIVVNIIITCIILWIIPYGLYIVITNLKEKILENDNQKLQTKKDELSIQYKDIIREKYSQTINQYNNIKKQKENYRDYIYNRLKELTFNEFKNSIIWIFNKKKYKVYKTEKQNIIIIMKNDKKEIVYINNSKGKLLLRDLKQFVQIRFEGDYELAKIYCLGYISSVLQRYCDSTKIELKNIENICNEICEIKEEEKKDESSR